MSVSITDDLTVKVIPNAEHEFLISTKDVALGYGVSAENIRSHKGYHPEEFIEGKHYVRGVGISNDLCKSTNYNDSQMIFWTKRGIVRLGFFIKSDRARMFRDWAEDFIIVVDEQRDLFSQVIPVAETVKRKHNRLTQERMIDILVDVAKIEDKKLRLSLIDKLTNV